MDILEGPYHRNLDLQDGWIRHDGVYFSCNCRSSCYDLYQAILMLCFERHTSQGADDQPCWLPVRFVWNTELWQCEWIKGRGQKDQTGNAWCTRNQPTNEPTNSEKFQDTQNAPRSLETDCMCHHQILQLTPYTVGARGGVVVKALRYKSAGRRFDSRWCHWNFSVT